MYTAITKIRIEEKLQAVHWPHSSIDYHCFEESPETNWLALIPKHHITNNRADSYCASKVHNSLT